MVAMCAAAIGGRSAIEVIAGKVIDADGTQHRFAFARNGASADQFAGALARAGVCRDTPATVLSDGDAGLRNLQARALPDASAWWISASDAATSASPYTPDSDMQPKPTGETWRSL